MPKKKKEDPKAMFARLCEDCQECVRTFMSHSVPPHVVHPVTGELGLYDVHCHAVCPKCKSVWYRGPQGTKLTEVP